MKRFLEALKMFINNPLVFVFVWIFGMLAIFSARGQDTIIARFFKR